MAGSSNPLAALMQPKKVDVQSKDESKEDKKENENEAEEEEKPLKKIMQIRLHQDQVYIILKGVFKIERYRDPDPEGHILESSDEDEEQDNVDEN